MKYLFAFVLGTLMGGAIALLFAPSSGDQLRSDLKSQIDTQSARLQEQWQRRYQQIQNRLDKMSGELEMLSEQSTEGETPA